MKKKTILIASTLVAGLLLTGCGDAEINVDTGSNVRTSQKAPVKSSSTSTVKSSSTGAVKSSSTSTAKSSANSTSKAKNEDRHHNDGDDHWAGCNYTDDEPEADPNDEYYYQYHDNGKGSSSIYSSSSSASNNDNKETYTHDTNATTYDYKSDGVAPSGQQTQEDN